MPSSLCCGTTRLSCQAVQYIQWQDAQVVFLTILDIRIRSITIILDAVLIEEDGRIILDMLIECYNEEQSRKEIMWIQSFLTMKTETDEYLP